MDIKINEFEGPLDLLLHLIKEKNMDIMNIEIESITKQYLAYLDLQEKMNLEVTSEYLVLASELIEIKSKLLLPKTKISEDLEEEDPREELVNRLLEYEAYKKITKVLKEKESIRRDIHTKMPESISNYLDDNISLESDLSLDDLVEAFKSFLQRKAADKPLKTKVTLNEISVSSRCHEIKMILKDKKRVSFLELFTIPRKDYIVATFLAILEMAKNKELVIIQKNNFQEIICEVGNE